MVESGNNLASLTSLRFSLKELHYRVKPLIRFCCTRFLFSYDHLLWPPKPPPHPPPPTPFLSKLTHYPSRRCFCRRKTDHFVWLNILATPSKYGRTCKSGWQPPLRCVASQQSFITWSLYLPSRWHHLLSSACFAVLDMLQRFAYSREDVVYENSFWSIEE